MKVNIEQIYTSVACNRIPEIADWNNEGIVCFGATNAVVVYDTEEKGENPLKVFSHHKSKVNSVKWIYKKDGTCTKFVSCSADKTAAIWSLVDGIWRVTSSLVGHTDGITCIYSIYTNEEDLIVYTGSKDSTVKVWEQCNDKSSVLLASASQDTYIRLWRIHLHTEVETTTEIRVEQKLFHAYGKDWSVKLEAILAGHEGWVYGVQWHPTRYDTNTKRNVPVYRLLSSSLDKTLIIWEPESSEFGEGAWVEKVRVGEVGGNGLGFYGSRFGPNGKSFLGHGYNGSFHIWTLNEETSQWEPRVVCGGHFGSVEDARWEPDRGRYLLSVSADQTTRLHAPWTKPDGVMEWHEVARPQVHGYDLASIAPLTATTFASAAEEKVIRVFQAPHNFLQNFHNIVGEKLVEEEIGGPEGASVPSLGLSNKAVFNGDDGDTGNKDDNDGYFVPVHLNAPPSEEMLMQNTLWPERRKLYGHGHEVFALAAAPDARLLASAARANTQEHAAVLIWETRNWQQIQKLVSHTLTVTQLAFSPDSQQLLSVSRDRKWTLYQRQQGTDMFEISACTDKSNGVHTRIIWCCAWAQDGAVFATGSRDGKVCVWHKTNQLSSTSLKYHSLCGKPLELANTSVTAIDFVPFTVDNKRVLATGFESGVIRIYSFCIEGWSLLQELDNRTTKYICNFRYHQPVSPLLDIFPNTWDSMRSSPYVCVWHKTNQLSSTSLKYHSLCGKPLELANTSVTAIDFVPFTVDKKWVLATGFESGVIRIYSFCIDGWSLLQELDNSAAHHLTVKRLMFNPKMTESESSKRALLASCGSDNFVRIHGVNISI
ncbi:putative elongator complex protein 2 [Papilio machaon]|uniref:Elongator complex protein 2 n=1 Tax=Papilio machaon TaxID=76193 RepID=A0A0N1PGV3_PAPMA|nr:putative elongator complex protein 2 [Papilio machaon]